MVRHFSDRPTEPLRAIQIWQILISEAQNRQTITDKMLGKILGYRGNMTDTLPVVAVQVWPLIV